jgi:AcrR family transcriptional regulator
LCVSEAWPARSGETTLSSALADGANPSDMPTPAIANGTTRSANVVLAVATTAIQLVRAAVPAFAQAGLHGTAVSTITAAVGVTQPYAFRLFKTKNDLFRAAIEHGFDRIERTVHDAVAGGPEEERRAAMGRA